MTRTTYAAAALLGTAALLATAAPATAVGTAAGVVRVVTGADGARVVYTAGAQQNRVTARVSGAAVVIDDVVNLKAGPGCTAATGDATRVTCRAAASWQEISISLGAGNDVVNDPEEYITFGIPVRIDGGAGNDTITGNRGDDVLLGGDGDDFLTGDDGKDVIDGGAGDDRVLGDGRQFDVTRSYQDTLRGGAGFDTVAWPESWEWINIDLNGTEAGSPLNAGDALAGDFEGAEGNAMMGTIAGNDADNVLTTGSSGITMEGRGGDDTLIGWDGNTHLSGGPGDDTLTIRSGGSPDAPANTLDGGENATAAGDTCFTPFPAKDILLGCER